ncbi:MAG: putative thioredoxin [Actinomycetota bacterium]|nr:putative thioredoxin [Actinomycetota bacterium]
MTQQPFSRPGAVDLSALKRPAQPGPSAARGGAAVAPGAFSVDLDEQNIQGHLEASMTAPVVLVVYSPSQAPESAQLAVDFDALADEFQGQFLVGKVDVDAAPALAQALQVPSVPMVALVVQGRLMPLLQDAAPLEELRGLMVQVLQQMDRQGVTGRHEPLSAGPGPEADEEYVDPRYVPAQEALASGDVDGAVREYQKLVDANPADTEAAGGLAMARLLQRTQDVDPAAAREAAAANRDDVGAQTLVADVDMLGGHVDDAFARLIDLVRRTAGAERDQARTHLLGLFAAVGNDDPRVLKGRQSLANALF